MSANPELNPKYHPATEDTVIVLRMFGNTARVASLGFKGEVDPFQMKAAAWYLEREAEKMISILERESARQQLIVTGQMPPPDVQPGDTIGVARR